MKYLKNILNLLLVIVLLPVVIPLTIVYVLFVFDEHNGGFWKGKKW